MNRRSFMKKVGGAISGVVALALPRKDIRSSAVEKMLNDKHISHTLFTESFDQIRLNSPYVIEFGTNKIHYLNEKTRT